MEGFNIRAPKGQKKNKRLGRGVGSGHGKTAGKGTKGQKARAGGGVRLGFEGGQMPLFRRIARRGFSNYPFKKIFQVVNVSDLNRFADGDTVTPETLVAKGLARKKRVTVKILGVGDLARRLVIQGVHVSATAREKITAMGGDVTAALGGEGKASGGTAKAGAAATADVKGTTEAN